mgnify:CR=1 FL=1
MLIFPEYLANQIRDVWPCAFLGEGSEIEQKVGLIKYTIDTTINNTQIIQVLRDNSGELARWVIDTREEQTREALIKLGWKPPEYIKDIGNSP